MSFSTFKLSKKIFYVLVACLPINLGLHFILPSAYVGGLLVDYLVPTIFVQDLLSIVLLAVWFYELFKKDKKIELGKYGISCLLLFYILFLSVFLSPSLLVSVYALTRWAIYIGVSLYVAKNFEVKTDFKILLNISCIWLIFLGSLALFQFIKQGSVFNNYLFLGEQPYSFSTPLIDKESFFGVTKIPAYGLFRHPNIFGGMLVIFLTLVTYGFIKRQLSLKIYFPAFVLGIGGLVLTLSYFSWIAFILGMALLLAERNFLLKKILISVFLILCGLALFIHKIDNPSFFADNPSFYKRAELMQAGYKMIASRQYLFGVGLDASTVFIENFTLPAKFIRFVQPTHNIFILLAMEAGILAVLVFVYILFSSLKHCYLYNYFIFVALLEVIFLGSFDHYFITIQQPFLLFWILVGIANARPFARFE